MAQAPAPQANFVPNPIPTNWECHICKKGPMLYANNTEKCATCAHKICAQCKCDNEIDPPLVTATPRPRSRALLYARDPDIFPTASIPSIYPIMGYHHTATRRRGKLSSHPNMARWWYCCEFHHLNNPVLAAARCSQCTHYRCSSCPLAQPQRRR